MLLPHSPPPDHDPPCLRPHPSADPHYRYSFYSCPILLLLLSDGTEARKLLRGTELKRGEEEEEEEEGQRDRQRQEQEMGTARVGKVPRTPGALPITARVDEVPRTPG